MNEGFWVRDQAKAHGTRQLIEGGLCRLGKQTRVVILDDVLTTGGSAMKAIAAVRALGCEVVLVLALVDRLQGAAQRIQRESIPCQSVFTIQDLGVALV